MKRNTLPVWMVTRTDNHTGMALPARDPEHAVLKARRYRPMRGAEIEVRGFVGTPIGFQPVTFRGEPS